MATGKSAVNAAEDLNPFRIAMRQFDAAAEKLKLDPGLREFLRSPRRAMLLNLPIKLDNGKIKVFQGFRVQHNNSRGPCKGGIRYHPMSALMRYRRWLPG